MSAGVIFDADGTLLDSMGFWTSTVYDIVAMSGVDEPEPGLIEKLTPMSMYEGAVYMKENYGIKMSVEEMIEEENRRVLEFYTTKVTLRPGMEELTAGLLERGIPMVVASATDRSMIESALAHTGIRSRFGAVLSCSDVGVGKDRPEIFLKACEIMGTKPENTLVVEDNPTAVNTAKNASFRTVMVNDDSLTIGAVLEMLK